MGIAALNRQSSIRAQRGGLLVITLVVGAGIGMGLAALATFSTGQGAEAERRITELNQTAAIQYAIDYQSNELAKLDTEHGGGASAKVLTNASSLKEISSDLTNSCLADMPWGPPPHDPTGTVASLWNSSNSNKGAKLIRAGSKTIDAVGRETHFAFEHYGRQLTSLTLTENDWVEFRRVNDVAYDNVFIDIWYRVEFEDADTFTEEEYKIPLAAYYEPDSDSYSLSIFAELSICTGDPNTAPADETNAECQLKPENSKAKGIYTYQLEQADGNIEHLNRPSDPVRTIEDGYWQYASFYIDLPAGSATSYFATVPETDLEPANDDADEDFGELERFAIDGIWKIGDADSLSDSAASLIVGAVRIWRQPGISSPYDVAKALYINDRTKPGAFHTETLGEPDGVLLAEGAWEDHRELADDEDGNSVLQLNGSWWGPALGQPTLITSQSGDDRNDILAISRQIFRQDRKIKMRSGPPTPTQLYRLYTCDDQGGAGRVELHRNLRRDGTGFAVSWKEKL